MLQCRCPAAVGAAFRELDEAFRLTEKPSMACRAARTHGRIRAWRYGFAKGLTRPIGCACAPAQPPDFGDVEGRAGE